MSLRYKPKHMIGGTVHDVLKNLETVSRIWASAGADCVMIRPAPDEITECLLARVSKTALELGIKIVFHPADEGSDNFSPSEPRLHEFMLKRFETVFERMNREPAVYENLAIVHPPRTSHPQLLIQGKRVLDEKTAMEAGKPFYDRLKELADEFGIGVAIENIHAPFHGSRHAELGYTLESLHEICNDRFGLCLDAAHAKLSWLGVGALLDCGIPLLAAHVHGNDGTMDAHLLPNKDNVGNLEDVERLLKQDIPILVEARSDKIIPAARFDGFGAYLERVVNSLKQGKLPVSAFAGAEY